LSIYYFQHKNNHFPTKFFINFGALFYQTGKQMIPKGGQCE